MVPACPSRSIAYSRPCGGTCGVLECPAAETACDCGTVAHLKFVVNGAPGDLYEAAFTCEGCLSVHWFRVRVQE